MLFRLGLPRIESALQIAEHFLGESVPCGKLNDSIADEVDSVIPENALPLQMQLAGLK
jgi:hypothetical protein